jgi:hypothetical protein
MGEEYLNGRFWPEPAGHGPAPVGGVKTGKTREPRLAG